MIRKISLIWPILLLMLLMTSAKAQQNENHIVDDLMPVLDREMIAVLIVNLEQADLGGSLQRLIPQLDNLSGESNEVANAAAQFLDEYSDNLIEQGATHLAILKRIGVLDDYEPVFRCKDAVAAKRVAKFVKENWVTIGNRIYSPTRPQVTGRIVHEERYSRYPKITPMDAAEADNLKVALDQMKDMPVQLAMTLSADQRNALVAGDPSSWKNGVTGSVRNFRWFSAGLNIQEKEIRFRIKSANKATAEVFANGFKEFMNTFSGRMGFEKNQPDLANWIGNLNLKTGNDQLELRFSDKSFDAMVDHLSELTQLIIKRQAMRKASLTLEAVAKAMLKYEEEHGTFPPPYSTDADGKPLLSWRVLILPYLDQKYLYQSFRLDEPWDSPHNIRYAGRVPRCFQVGETKMVNKQFQTRLLALVSENSALREKTTTIGQVVDGTVNTLSTVIASPQETVVWSKPDDLSGTPESISQKLIESSPNGFWAASCDSSVHFVMSGSDAKKLALAIQIDDGQIIGDGKTLQRKLAGPDSPGPLFDATAGLPQWWMDIDLIPQPAMIGALSSQ